MANIHKAYEATIHYVNGDKKVKYEILATPHLYYIFYFGYIIHQVKNEATPEENFEAAKKLLFSQPDRTFQEVEVRR